MTPERDEERRSAEADARFVARLREAYAPEPHSAAERLASARALEARLERERRRHGRRLLPALAGAGLAAAVAWLVLAPPPPLSETPAGRSVPTAAGEDWATQIIFADEAMGSDSDSGSVASDGALPAEYVAIASVFLDE